MSHFRTISLSDPRFEVNGLKLIVVKSQHLAGRGEISLFAPEGFDPKAPVQLIILLHGVYGSHWSWSMKGGAHITAQQMIHEGRLAKNTLVAMPSDGLWGDGSSYTTHHGYSFEKWIVEDVPIAVKEACEIQGDFQHQFLAGLSMGGFGTLYLGTKYHTQFTAISGHSSITHLDQMAIFVEETLEGFPLQEPDILEVCASHKDQLPAIRIDCGIDDVLIEQNRSLHRSLQDLGIKHIYEEFPGGHEWPYWEAHIEKSYAFFEGFISI